MAKTGYGNFDYTLQGWWRGALHNFHVAANHSGAPFSASDGQTFCEGASSPMALTFGCFMSPQLTVVSARYYNGTQSTPIWAQDYDAEHPVPQAIQPSASAFSSVGGAVLPLEVCVGLEGQTGLGKTGKPVYIRKFLRGAPAAALSSSEPDGGMVWAFNNTAQGAAHTASNGSWYQNRVYISPTGAQTTSNGMVALADPLNHQVPRGRKRSTRTASPSLQIRSIKTILENGAEDEG